MSLLLVPPSGPTISHAFRLPPNYPLKQSLLECAETIFARDKKCSSLFVMTCVGSLKGVKLRLANASKRDIIIGPDNSNSSGNDTASTMMGGSNDVREWIDERFEIVSLTGTFCRDGSCHLHLAIADANGNSFGGHLLEGRVFTTAEIVLGSAENVEFTREMDDETGYKELVVKQKIQNDDGCYLHIWTNEICKLTLAVFAGFMLGTSFLRKQ